ncbi:MAG: hypothetical protein JTT16_00420 [Candidatus Brockarchaeota archaeon]|nr:hypothetical protein [Candidatus Brockarchaeota archaeon]MBO3802068.1 hypothetical protein [Candidatus Brockarchaeota archaeon]
MGKTEVNINLSIINKKVKVRFKPFVRKREDAAEYLLKEAKVLVYGGSGFGEGGSGHVRINFCSPLEIIEDATIRIRTALTKKYNAIGGKNES